ncbi:FtsH protease activity modulator HflK [Jannaschia seohaensis]|uniref:Protein HflK n=1 Tax=Jannaschia seohaensis TaxID=475081 RepID=A0A2Y9C7T7_9RHOB|nr:FtsH protease activity modulator HflK [Jannaschia seohaensis]PWJ18208.1 membrane protease subunit HflK [Jannaschia seohaensis]SSA46733.1 membrane protease subunit HflK [Jannaschia seohaensis]
MAGNGGPWGGGGNSGGGRGSNDGPGRGPDRPGGGPRRPGEGSNIPEIDDLVRKGQDQLRVLMGGRGGGPRRPNGGGGSGPGFEFNRTTIGIGLVAALGLWTYASIYTVRPEERSVELFLGDFTETVGQPGLNFAPWPVVTAEVIPVTTERTVDIGVNRGNRLEQGLMLTGDENVVDIDFQVVWNIADPAEFLFNLRDPEQSIRAVSESAMREIVARSQLAPILNRDRGIIADELRELIQSTLNSYDAGVNIIRVNFDRADPPEQVIDAFRDVQAAEQQRDRLQSEADAYANRVLAAARGEAAQLLEEAEGYRARVVNEAEGEASRFTAVLQEYSQAPEVTRKRLYLETMEQVLGDVDKIIIDEGVGGGQGGQGVIPFLPLNELRGGRTNQGGTN